MNKIPKPPDFLTEQAKNAFFRIYHFLESRGLWHEIDNSLLAVTADTCSQYLTLAKTNVLPASETEKQRTFARELLAGFCYIPENRVYLAAIDSNGLDADIVAVCEPFKTHQNRV